MSDAINKKQELFVSEYLVDLNATQAAIRAGYSRRDARNAGYRNLRRPQIKAAIDKAQAPRLAKLALDADTVLAELTRIARANLLDYMRFDEDGIPIVDLSRLDRETAAALSEVVVEEFLAAKAGRPAVRRVRFRMHDKLAALDKLARHFGLLRERVGPENPDAAEARPQHDPRQVARAVVAILEEAAIAEAEAKGADRERADGHQAGTCQPPTG
jgi:phage terminase small subunit